MNCYRPRPPAPLAALVPLVVGLAAGCGSAPEKEADAGPPSVISPERILAHVEVLASDRFEGRAPGTPGEELTVAYMTEQFEALGVEPGNPDGTWVQNVPLVGFRGEVEGSFAVGGETLELTGGEQYVALSRRSDPEVKVEDSEVVFVGYGVVAPEYGWDDYKGLDVRGKTLVMLVNDPAVPAIGRPGLDPNFFNGRAMTYYGRWTYKYEIASELGAAAAIVVHQTGPAGYPWAVISAGWGRENFDIASADGSRRVAVEAWITDDVAEDLFARSGHDFAELARRAVRSDFEPVSLGATASFTVRNERRTIQSRNIVARIPGTKYPDETIVYTAHWDHLGRNEALEGDQIYNGALDNATGTGGLVEIARAFMESETPPERSILMLAVTAEEKGLLGSKYYAANPLYPLEKTLANINVDVLNPWGPTHNIVCVGYGNSTLEDVLEEEARAQGRRVSPDGWPEKGYFYRSDHFSFAKQGVPALYADSGDDFVGKPADWGQLRQRNYTANDYHKPSDELRDDWDARGMAQDLELLFRVGLAVANGDTWPTWRPGNEFEATRKAMLGE